jgi:hypothetical protein
MAKVNETEPLQKHTLHLFEGDYQRLQNLYPELGAAIIIRRIVREHIKGIEAQLTDRKLEGAHHV